MARTNTGVGVASPDLRLRPGSATAWSSSAAGDGPRFREGADVDVVGFDPERIHARATFEELTPPEGTRYVLVDGSVVVRKGVVPEGARSGRRKKGAVMGQSR